MNCADVTLLVFGSLPCPLLVWCGGWSALNARRGACVYHSYHTMLLMGSNQQAISVVVDTGSSNLAVVGFLSVNCALVLPNNFSVFRLIWIRLRVGCLPHSLTMVCTDDAQYPQSRLLYGRRPVLAWVALRKTS
jgi:hypothetical protein